jgi:hypothetical protein
MPREQRPALQSDLVANPTPGDFRPVAARKSVTNKRGAANNTAPIALERARGTQPANRITVDGGSLETAMPPAQRYRSAQEVRPLSFEFRSR